MLQHIGAATEQLRGDAAPGAGGTKKPAGVLSPRSSVRSVLNTGYVSVRWICRKRQCKVGTVTLVDRMKRVSGAQSSGIPTGAQPSGPAGAQSSGAGLPMPDRPSVMVGGQSSELTAGQSATASADIEERV